LEKIASQRSREGSLTIRHRRRGHKSGKRS
jgi:hypothetical protein